MEVNFFFSVFLLKELISHIKGGGEMDKEE
jgi:hypothetical protein